jgi:hypothetical protein
MKEPAREMQRDVHLPIKVFPPTRFCFDQFQKVLHELGILRGVDNVYLEPSEYSPEYDEQLHERNPGEIRKSKVRFACFQNAAG